MSQVALFEPSSPVPTGNTPSWFTPLGWLLALEQELLAAGLLRRPFDLDPCGHPEAPVSREILRRGGVVYTAADDGLSKSWFGRTPFVNPPFDAENADRWCAKVQNELALDADMDAVMHLPAWTDRGWWQDHIEPDRLSGRCQVRFHRGRKLYGWPGNPHGLGGDTAKFPSSTTIWSIQFRGGR